MASTTIQTLVDYYVALLILQYGTAERAKATIEATTKVLNPINSETGELLLKDVETGFDVDTAIGPQLDTIGKYVGLERFFNDFADISGSYFGFAEYSENPPDPSKYGLTDYAGFDGSTIPVLTYDDFSIVTNFIDDETYRFLIKLKILKNTIDHSNKSIDDGLFTFFGTDLVMDDNLNMTMTYFVETDILSTVQLAAQKDLLPRPIGVGVNFIEQLDGGYFGFATYDQDTYTDPLLNGFTTYPEFETKVGNVLSYDKLIS